MNHLLAAIALLAVILTASATMAPYEEVLWTKINYYRALSGVDSLIYNEPLSGAATTWAGTCGVQYDYFANEGQIIFNIGDQNGSFPDVQQATYFAADHWYDMRHSYTIQSDEYDDLSKFYSTWEYTEMIWEANTDLGCAWATSECGTPSGSPAPNSLQLVCLTLPGGNKWDQFGANVHCPDCNTQAQTATVDTKTISFTKRAVEVTAAPKRREVNTALVASLEAELERLESYRTLPLSQFIPGYANFPRPEETSVSKTIAPGPISTASVAKRSMPPRYDDATWKNSYLMSVNAHRAKNQVSGQVTYNDTLAGLLVNQRALTCVWPQSQDFSAEQNYPQYNYAWWLTDDTTTDFNHEFDVAMHMWQVWGNHTDTKIGNLWKTWHDQLLDQNTNGLACVWTPQCSKTSKPSYLMFCAAGPKRPV